jgi:hypothetical protein
MMGYLSGARTTILKEGELSKCMTGTGSQTIKKSWSLWTRQQNSSNPGILF